MCEKALAEYLETKRLAFPRFYFVSSSDLLAILSKGNEPTEVKMIVLFVVCFFFAFYCILLEAGFNIDMPLVMNVHLWLCCCIC